MKRLMLFLLFAAHGAAANSPADYAAVFPIETVGSQTAWLIELDADVYRWSQDEKLRDIAIFNAAGNPVPLGPWDEIVPSTIIENEAAVPLMNLPVTLVPNYSKNWSTPGENRKRDRQPVEVRPRTVPKPPREWLIDASMLDFGVDTITLDWDSPQSGVVARFNVAGSSDLQHWMFSRKDAMVINLEQDDIRIDRRDIRLERGYSPYFLLTRMDDGADLVGLRAKVSGEKRERGAALPLQWVQATYRSAVNDNASMDVQYRYLLPAAFPVSQLRIALTEDNALARLHVLSGAEAIDGSMRWNSRGQSVAYRLQRDGDLIESPEILLSAGPRVRELRIDSPTPLALPPEIQAGYRPQRVVFLAEGEGPYVLAAGNAVARYPEYPMDTALAKLRETRSWQPPLAKLGGMRHSAGERALVAPVAQKEAPGWKRGLLWAVLILAAAVVGGLSLSLLRGSGQSGTKDGQQPPEE